MKNASIMVIAMKIQYVVVEAAMAGAAITVPMAKTKAVSRRAALSRTRVAEASNLCL